MITSNMPRPMLNVRSISSEATLPRLQVLEDRQHRPTAHFDHGGGAARQHARQIFGDTAARNVGQAETHSASISFLSTGQ